MFAIIKVFLTYLSYEVPLVTGAISGPVVRRQQIMELMALVPYNLVKQSITQGLPPLVQSRDVQSY